MTDSPLLLSHPLLAAGVGWYDRTQLRKSAAKNRRVFLANLFVSLSLCLQATVDVRRCLTQRVSAFSSRRHLSSGNNTCACLVIELWLESFVSDALGAGNFLTVRKLGACL